MVFYSADACTPNSYKDGYATARLELMCGYPGYLYLPDDGNKIYGVDGRLGLPVFQFGDNGPDTEWCGGFNQAVIDYSEEHGLPWNSRLSALNELQNLDVYFRDHKSEAFCMNSERPRVELAEFGASLHYRENIGPDTRAPGAKAPEARPVGPQLRRLENEPREIPYVEVKSKAMFKDPGLVRSATGAYRTGPPPKIGRKPDPLSCFGPGTSEVPIWDLERKRIWFVPGPRDSHLIIVKHSELVRLYSALDLQWGYLPAAMGGELIILRMFDRK